MAEPPADRLDVEGLSPLRWRVGWTFVALVAPLAVFGIVRAAVGRDLGWAPLVVAIAALFAVFGMLTWPTRLRFSEDGVSIRRFGISRFIPYAAISRVELVQRLGTGRSRSGEISSLGASSVWTVYTLLRISLERGDGIDVGLEGHDEPVFTGDRALFAGGEGLFAPLPARARAALVELERRVADARRQPNDGSSVVAALLRRDMAVEEWRRGLLAEGARSGAHAYRAGDASTEALFRVLEDDEAPREARAGAAVALRCKVDAAGRERMRVVADGSTSPKLRAAVETALDDDADEQRIDEVLEAASRASPGSS
jgi:hypothetical protein